jgi:PAS domain S-box-containing protein
MVSRYTGDWLQARIDVTDTLARAMQVEGAAYAVDRSRHIVAWNDDAMNMTGYQPRAVVGATCWLSGLDHRDVAGTRLCFGACPLVRAMQTGEPQTDVVSLRTAGGGRKWVRTVVHPVRDQGGRVIGAVEKFSRTRRPDGPQA